MAEKDKTPEIRFAGFSDAWERRKLGELYTERKERGHDALPILSVSIHHGVSSAELDSDTLGKKVRRSEDKSLYKHVYCGDLVLNMMRAWQGAVGVVKSEGMVSPAYITAVPSAQLYPLFMDYCLRREETVIQIDNLSYGVTDFRKRLYWDSFIDVVCHIPTVPEQERMTSFFKHLDHLIALHQRKLDELIIVKKSMLQKMFPLADADVPEIRFAGFTEAWEQRKISELISPVVRDVPKPTEPYKKISVRSHAKGTFHQKIENPDTVAMDKLFVVRENDLIVNITFAWEHAIAVATKEDDGLLVSHRFPTYTMSNSDVGFMKYVVSQENFRQKMELISPGGAGRNRVLDKKDFLNIEVIAPIKIDEQNKIGTFFTNLDHLITLQQRKLEKLKNLKKSLLEKMFV